MASVRAEGARSAEAVQLLTPEGERVAHPDYDINPSDADLRSLYREMVLVRRLDTEATALQRQGELGLWAPCQGQEAAQIGSARVLRPTDFAFPTYRDHGVTWSRGVAPLEMLAMYRGVTNGGWNPRERHCALPTIVIGNQALHGVGYAMGIQLDGSDDVVVTYFGDGATAEGDVNESFVFAAEFNAPVIFFCQNNQWAISSPRERPGAVPIFERAAGFGFPGVQVDGNDVLAIMAVTIAMMDRARAGEGPSLIEAYTYRMGAHTTSDDPTRYRQAHDLEVWRLRDPIERLKVFLARQGIADRHFFDSVDHEAGDLAISVRDGVRSMQEPPPESLFDHVYAEPHAGIEQERLRLRAYEATFADGGHA
jgi:2-oxoisovalerate dehydrogenase E1 component alpha subunit